MKESINKFSAPWKPIQSKAAANVAQRVQDPCQLGSVILRVQPSKYKVDESRNCDSFLCDFREPLKPASPFVKTLREQKTLRGRYLKSCQWCLIWHDVGDASHKLRFIQRIESSKEGDMVQEEKIDKQC